MHCFLHLLLATICFFSLHLCLALDSLTFTKPIKDSETLVSQGGRFRFGFFSTIKSTNKYVGIWFNDVSPQTVVWVANKNTPISNSSGVILISNDGNLMVTNGLGQVFWSTNLSAPLFANATKAKLMDSGNLVLQGSNGETLWESFNYPSDTFLPGMKLGKDSKTGENRKITSWKSLDDPSPGSYSFGIAPLKFPELYIWEKELPKWRTGPWNGQAFIGSRRNPRERFKGFNLEKDNQGKMLLSYEESSLLLHFKLEPEGVVHEKAWNKEKQEWSSGADVPGPPCNSYGKCGEFGICSFNETVPCKCVKGFVPKNQTEWSGEDWRSGCVRKEPLHCERGSNNNWIERDAFLKLEMIKVPISVEYSEANEKGCEKTCVDDCNCTAYTYNDVNGCMLWRRSLLDLQDSMRNGVSLYIRVANSSAFSSKQNHTHTVKISIGITVAFVGIALSILSVFIWLKFAKGRGRNRNARLVFQIMEASSTISNVSGSILVNQPKLEELPLFEFQVLATATDNFALTNKLGQGGFGLVYKGKLQEGQEIAVKRLSPDSGQGLEELMNEVIVISKLQHRNLVKLLGCCIEGKERMLVYEFMPKKSLDHYLFDPQEQTLLDWKTRFNIINGICRGLVYLHRDSRLRIIHRDLKVSNILLDEHMNPKISDFGLAKIFHINEDEANTSRVIGTYGYMSPEYAMRGLFSEKSDVFSLGVVLLEIVSGRKNSSFFNDDK
uniref:Receptor-like serine/threonine-protein kinase n=2 Tax=Noccaea caerulescens TaxID=107243 RepID=A0A1J3FFP7_NOCCA